MRNVVVFLFVICCTVPLFSFAQEDSYKSSTFTIEGVVLDESGIALPQANLFLLSLPDSSEVSSTWTDSLGVYKFNSVGDGSYTVLVMQVGYEKMSSIPIQKRDTVVVHYLFKLRSETHSDQVITVTGRRPVIRQEDGKMIVSVENMLAVSGLSAFETLKRSPGITTDNNGNIMLRGKTGVLVMLDDKPLYMTAEQVSNLLKAIPSDQIKEIELITSPSAKYDAAGTAGIINIKLKKGAYEGLHGTFNVSYGQGFYHKANTGVLVSYKKKKLSINSGYQYSNKVNLFEQSMSRTYGDSSSIFSAINSNSSYRSPTQSHTFTFGSNYDVTERTKVSLDVIGAYTDYAWHAHNYSALANRDSYRYNSAYATDDGLYSEINYNINLGLSKQLDTNGTSISGSVNYTRYTGVSNRKYEVLNFDSLNQLEPTSYLYVFRDPSYNNQYSGKLDFSGKVWKNIGLESGLKLIVLDKSNPAFIAITQNNNSTDHSNPFLYHESIAAVYMNANRKFFKKWEAKAGLRLEHTNARGIQTVRDTSFQRDYTNLFPSFNLSFNASEKTTYTLSYSRRIERPASWQLNPVLSFVDPYSGWSGNPYLLPQYTDNVECSQSFFGGGLVTTLNYSYTRNPIAWALLLDSTSLIAISQPRNLVLYENAGMSVAINAPVTKWWTTSVYAYGYLNHYVGDLGYGMKDSRQISADFNTTQTFNLSKKTTAEVSGSYETPWVYGLNSLASRGQLNLALQRKIWAGKASIKIAVSDLFWTDRWRPSNSIGTLSAKSTQREDTRIVMCTFNYKFGGVVHRL